MVHWKDVAEVERDAEVYARLWPVFMGIYLYDFLQTLWFEWWLVTRKIPFKWPYIPYFVGRYSLLAMFSVMNTINYRHDPGPTQCDGRYYILTISTAIGTGCASLNLAIRTLMIWNRQPWITASVALLSLGHWAVLGLSSGTFIHIGNRTRFGICMSARIYNSGLMMCYIYTLIFDLVVLCGAVVGLVKDTPHGHIWQISDIRRLLVVQGLGYFIVASFVNVFSAVFAALRLNPIMDIMLGIPALVLSMIASCHCVSGLLSYKWRPLGLHEATTDPDVSAELPQFSTQCVLPAATVSSHEAVSSAQEKSVVQSPLHAQYVRASCQTPMSP